MPYPAISSFKFNNFRAVLGTQSRTNVRGKTVVLERFVGEDFVFVTRITNFCGASVTLETPGSM